MKHIKQFENIKINNASCNEYIQWAIETTIGNPMNFEYLKDTADSLDTYSTKNSMPSPAEPGHYKENTLNKFKELITLMIEDEIQNSLSGEYFEEEERQISFKEWKKQKQETKKFNL